MRTTLPPAEDELTILGTEIHKRGKPTFKQAHGHLCLLLLARQRRRDATMPSAQPSVQRRPDLASSSLREGHPLCVSRWSTGARRGPTPCRHDRPRTCPPPASRISRPLPWLG